MPFHSQLSDTIETFLAKLALALDIELRLKNDDAAFRRRLRQGLRAAYLAGMKKAKEKRRS